MTIKYLDRIYTLYQTVIHRGLMGSVAVGRLKRRGGENVQYISTSLGNILPMCGKRIHTEAIGTRDAERGAHRGVAFPPSALRLLRRTDAKASAPGEGKRNATLNEHCVWPFALLNKLGTVKLRTCRKAQGMGRRQGLRSNSSIRLRRVL